MLYVVVVGQEGNELLQIILLPDKALVNLKIWVGSPRPIGGAFPWSIDDVLFMPCSCMTLANSD